MAQRSAAAGVEPGTASLLAQLDGVCELLRDASGEQFRLVTDQESVPENSTELEPGWALAGSDDARRREAAAELLGHVLTAEREIESLCTEILDRYEEVTLIQRIGLRMADAMDDEGLAQIVIREVTDWLHARAGEIWLRDGESTQLAGALPADRLPAGPLGELGPLEALTEATDWAQDGGSGTEPVVAVPIPSGGRDALGVLVVRGKEGNRAFDQREIQLLTAVAALTSGYLRSHRLARDSWLDQHTLDESDLVRLLHPRRVAVCEGLEISFAFLDGQRRGSDYHDLVPTPDGGVALNLARVSASGPRAVAHLVLAKGVFQAEARTGSSPGGMMRRVSDVLSPELIRSDLFATAMVARFLPGGRGVDLASAGHGLPLLRRAGCDAEEIELAGPALGLLSSTRHDETHQDLEPGDLLVFHSDGFVDARNPDGNGLDLGYLRELTGSADGATAEEIRDQLIGALETHCAGRALEDDATLVVVRVV